MSLINSGNRTGIITGVTVFYMQPEGATEEPSCDFESGSYFMTDFEPTVLKASEAVVKTIKPNRPRKFISSSPAVELTEGGDFVLPLGEHNKNKKDILIDACLHISLATPSTPRHTVTFPAFRFHALENEETAYDPDKEGTPLLPVLLIKRTATIFSD
jgi:hypothetical protein